MRGRFVPARLRLLVAAYGVSLTGSSTLPIALTFTVLERRWPTSDIGLIMVATSLPLVLTLPMAGVAGDRVRRGALMVGADGARFVSQGALGLLLLGARPPFPLVFVLVGAVGVGDALFNPSLSALVPAIAPGEEQRANALLGVTASVATLAGPALGGLLVAAGRPPSWRGHAWAVRGHGGSSWRAAGSGPSSGA
ncbi:MFS transporter [Acidimicrobiaceae bacterium USS-CC1]|uniref:MFS transporter n=1 Tax=Acidiferrimicrobium australe TaxID=2664430 RepID=A0ABW9QPL2_9ACTN|nr:MFS transporter [Acidiferrimicrobium australe]